MTPARFTLRLASGEVVGPVAVHGAGGPLAVDAAAHLRLALRRVAEGRRLVGISEPQPGHVRAYVHEAAGDSDERLIDLRGAELVAVE